MTLPLIIDNFAGGGGASTGIETALGRPVDIAINHNDVALAMHRANHPDTLHLCEDVFNVSPRKVCAGRPVGLAWFSPDCKHFSKAKGGKPVDRRVRGLAWVAVRWAKEVRPAVIVLENVEEFVTWGPLGNDGKPDPLRRGLTFKKFVGALRGLGYNVEWRELVAADYGAPTTRKRFFLIARCDGMPVVWPEKTHGVTRIPWRTAYECIDWTIPCPSIFERKRPLKDATLRRIYKGIMKYVVTAKDPFIIPYYGTKTETECRAKQLDLPLPTQTTENRFGLVVPTISKYYGQGIGHDMGVPMSTLMGSHNHHALCTTSLNPVIPTIVKNYGGPRAVFGHEVTRPLGTVTTVDHHSLCTTSLSHAPGQHSADVRAFLIKYYGTGGGQSLNEPMATVTTRDRFGLVTIKGVDYRIVDIGLRMLQPRELFRAQGFPDIYRLIGTKTDQVRLCGNSVCPPVAEAIVRANCGHIAALIAA